MLELLGRARQLGFLGPGPVEDHVRHANALAEVVEPQVPATVADLGSGGGVPGLVLALRWPDARLALVESAERRAAFLLESVVRLGLEDRVRVLADRAEVVGHDPSCRGAFSLVAARSFAAPAVTAECAAGLLQVGGRLVVSEPPQQEGERWPASGLAVLGMEPAGAVGSAFFHFQIVRQAAECPEDYPRRTGVPAKRPLF
ncbi:MAG TPA: RsmG family class I SAM-dependent methyltransferase [Acidimicrobiales bacterium]|nr:RsmG family class I SAM-dependent methyltransferase [Acidimicrobiales bacterium]